LTEHPNVERTRQGYDAFAKGDLVTLAGLIAGDVIWHVAGPGPLSGTYRGRDEVFRFFGDLARETDGTFRLDVHDVLANDQHSVALCTMTASRGGKSLKVPVANIGRMRDGKIAEFWTSTAEPEATVTFWS